jgi:(2Fe-2S) ferredoxin
MPQFQYHVFFCTNERSSSDPKSSCHQRGAVDLHAHAKAACHALGMKGSVRINKAGCLDACAEGPAVVVYGEKAPAAGTWYTLENKEDVDAFIQGQLVSGNVVDRLRLRRPGA